MVILKKEAIESLNEKLSLQATGIEQDWEVELADPNRVHEFISYYKKYPLTSDEKKALMSLILASYDDFLNEKKSKTGQFWNDIRQAIESDHDLLTELLDYWILPDEDDSENWFKITPLIRKIKM